MLEWKPLSKYFTLEVMNRKCVGSAQDYKNFSPLFLSITQSLSDSIHFYWDASKLFSKDLISFLIALQVINRWDLFMDWDRQSMTVTWLINARCSYQKLLGSFSVNEINEGKVSKIDRKKFTDDVEGSSYIKVYSRSFLKFSECFRLSW